MKQGLFTLGLSVALSIMAGCRSQQEGWKLVWEENFDQEDHFDEASWSKIPRGKSDWNNYMSDFDSCYTMRDGNLVLRGLVNYSLPADTAPFITGGVYTKGKVGFSDGRLDIRAKLYGATGAWPAFWLLPENEGWPNGGEIDIMERLNNDTIAYQTVHSAYTYTLGIKDNPKQGGIGFIRTFAYPRIETDKEGQFPFTDKKFYLLLDMQLGGSWVGAVDSSDLPVEMEIDWVRFYQKKK